MSTDCRKYRNKCFLCKRTKHHPALCYKRRTQNEQSKGRSERVMTTISDDEREASEVSTSAATYRSCLKDPRTVHSLLKCARVTIYNPLNSKLRKRILAFLDDGSEKSYISKNLIKELGLKEVKEVQYEAKGLGGVKIGSFRSAVVEFGLKGKNVDLNMRARELDKVMPKLPFIEFRQRDVNKLQTNRIRIPPVFEEPSMLIGGDYYNHFDIRPEVQLSNGFWISNSKLGKIINGEGKMEYFSKQSVKETSAVISSSSVDDQIIKFDASSQVTEELEDSELSRIVDRHQQLETIGLGDAKKEEILKFITNF